MAQKDLLNRSIDAGREARGKAQERIEGLLDDLTKAAQEQREQVQQIAQDLFDKSQKSSEQVLKVMDREIRAQISHLGLATKADIRRLEKKIEALQKDQGPPSGRPRRRPTKKSSTKKSATKKSTTKKAPAKRVKTRPKLDRLTRRPARPSRHHGPMSVVGLVVHEQKPEAAALAGETAAWLTDRPHACGCPTVDAERIGLGDLAVDARGLRRRPRRGRQPGRRRHHPAHGRPAGRGAGAGGRREPRPARLPHRGRAAPAARPASTACWPATSWPTTACCSTWWCPRAASATDPSPGAQRGRARARGQRPHRAHRRRARWPALHALRGRRPDHVDAHRLDGLRLLGPRPDHRAVPPGPVADPGVAAHAVRSLAGARHQDRGAAHRRPAIATPCSPSTVASSARSLPATASSARRRTRVARLVTTQPGRFHAILKAKFGLSDR